MKGFRHIQVIFFAVLFVAIGACNKDDLEPENPEVNPKDKLAQISIDTKGGVIVDEPKTNADIAISKNEQLLFQGNIGIEYRGASSQALFPKKSFGIETRDENNEDLDVSLLDFPEEEDWILYGPYSDRSLMRNVLIYNLSRDINRYASRTSFVELTVNKGYLGVYVFMEKLKRDVNRINISRLDITGNSGEDLTGGYILKIDKTEGSNLGEGYNELNSFRSIYTPNHAAANQSIYFLYEYPDAEDITSAQKDYISSYVADFENALASNNFRDENLGYRAYIDVDSFIDFFLLNELSNNVDGYRLSTYMHKDKNSKLKMGPIWDFNLAFGNADYCSGGETNVWAYRFNERCSSDFWLVPFWWERLLQDQYFVDQLKNRWSTLRMDTFSETNIINNINSSAEVLTKSGAIDQNFKKWPIFNTYIWPNRYIGGSYSEETNYLQSWVLERLIWLDNAINNL